MVRGPWELGCLYEAREEPGIGRGCQGNSWRETPECHWPPAGPELVLFSFPPRKAGGFLGARLSGHTSGSPCHPAQGQSGGRD